MNQEFVWWTSSILTVLLTGEKVWGWATYRRKQRASVEVVARGAGGATGHKTLRASSFAIRFDSKRGVGVIPGYGTVAIDLARLKAARRDRRGFNLIYTSAAGEVEDSYTIVSEWPL